MEVGSTKIIMSQGLVGEITEDYKEMALTSDRWYGRKPPTDARLSVA